MYIFIIVLINLPSRKQKNVKKLSLKMLKSANISFYF